jgi:hypothetical protein
VGQNNIVLGHLRVLQFQSGVESPPHCAGVDALLPVDTAGGSDGPHLPLLVRAPDAGFVI